MSASDDKLQALMDAAVAGQERLQKEEHDETPNDSVLVIEDEDPSGGDDDEEQVLPAVDETRTTTAVESTAETEPPPPGKPAKPPKKTAQEVVTEALIKAKQEALEILAQTQKEAKSMQERLLRVSADFDNFRKRTRKQQEDAIKYANESLLRELLPVIDNFDRAIEHVPADSDDPLAQGVKMVHMLLISTLEKLNCKGFSAVGKAFDPEHHEAVEQQATDEVPAGSVVREYQKGYLLADRLLRPAMVVVATPASPPAPSKDAASDDSSEPQGAAVNASAEPATSDDTVRSNPAEPARGESQAVSESDSGESAAAPATAVAVAQEGDPRAGEPAKPSDEHDA